MGVQPGDVILDGCVAGRPELRRRVCHSVVVAFSSLARIVGECSTIHSLPALFFFFFKWRSASAR